MPEGGWAESVGEDLRRHLAGEVRAILASVGGGAPRPGATGEELPRLAERRPALARLLGLRVELWIGAMAELSRVSALTFADGGRVVYKPRSIEVEAAWAGLVDWIDAEAGAPRLRAQRVLPRPGYGWAEFIISGGPAGGAAEPATWYRCGWLLALLHALGASDCHSGNLVLAGGWPYVIDLETVLTPGHLLE
ncbi:MAG: DUF4135 domain-containing protein, partial [Acidimicrobiia bacterium]